MRRKTVFFWPALLICAFVDSAFAATYSVVPFEFDPGATNLVAAKWKTGLGCPTSGILPAFASAPAPPFGDFGCITGDDKDKHNDGLLLSKQGPTDSNASAGATILGVKGIYLSELGYDIRKPDSTASPSGSHCTASPKFVVVTWDGIKHVVECQSGNVESAGDWIRLRFPFGDAAPPIAVGQKVKNIQILLDEGAVDTPPDFFGLAVLDNIDINGTLIGRGPKRVEEADGDEGYGGDKDHNFTFCNSPSRPETSKVSYYDRLQSVKVQTVSAARSISYNGTCVSFVADALFNDDPGYVLTFSSCDLSALSTPLVPQIGSYSVVVAGPLGTVYQKSGAMTVGAVFVHLP